VFSRGPARLAALAAALRNDGLAVRPVQLGGNLERLDAEIATADLVIGAVLEPGTLSPKLISRAAVRAMRPGSALVDVGIDQGGIAATSRMTTMSSPTYVEERVVHYAVPNMPALVARTATLALAAALLPRVQLLADAGIAPALDADPGLAQGAMIWDGAVVHGGLAADTGISATAAPWRAGHRRVA
jgi:alanine dehydrogenase